MAYTTINKSSDYFNTKLYTGTGSNQSITGVGFQPDLIWGKGRTLAGYNHGLVDSVRGTGKNIYSNLTEAEATYSTGVTSFDSDGFSVGSGNVFNNASQTYVAWNWLADNTSGSSNTDGSITSTVSANTTSGFSIVSWTGNGNIATIGHGLGVTPSMYIVKNRSIVESWVVYHKGLNSGSTPEDFHLVLENLDAQANYPVWNDTAPTSSVFTVNGYSGTNGNTNNMLAYCFADVKGFSKFGSYTGNGNADGTFVYTGFKPAFVINKRTDSIGNWNMRDIKRDTNENTNNLYSNLSNAEASDQGIDFLSNGFKQRNNGGDNNASGASYIYMAFAEAPLVGTNNVPATAR